MAVSDNGFTSFHLSLSFFLFIYLSLISLKDHYDCNASVSASASSLAHIDIVAHVFFTVFSPPKPIISTSLTTLSVVVIISWSHRQPNENHQLMMMFKVILINFRQSYIQVLSVLQLCQWWVELVSNTTQHNIRERTHRNIYILILT